MINFTMIVRDRQELTAQTLHSLEMNSAGYDLTVTIIDDQSKPQTEAYLREWARACPAERVLVRMNHSRGTGWARNLSIYVSEKAFGRGDYIYLSDNDCFFTEKWLDKMIAAFPDARVGVLGGYGHPYHLVNEKHLTASGHEIGFVNAVATQSWMMTWETWDKYGPFEAKSLGVRKSEDWAFCQKIRKDGGEVGVLLPNVVHNTGKTDTFGDRTPGSEYMPSIKGVTIL